MKSSRCEELPLECSEWCHTLTGHPALLASMQAEAGGAFSHLSPRHSASPATCSLMIPRSPTPLSLPSMLAMQGDLGSGFSHFAAGRAEIFPRGLLSHDHGGISGPLLVARHDVSITYVCLHQAGGKIFSGGEFLTLSLGFPQAPCVFQTLRRFCFRYCTHCTHLTYCSQSTVGKLLQVGLAAGTCGS